MRIGRVPEILMWSLGILPCAGLVAAEQASTPTAQPITVTLTVVATDGSGQPVTDLTAKDFKVSDNGAQQQMIGFKRNETKGPQALVLLFDLLNLDLANEGFEWQQMKQSIPEMPASDSLYLYLLVKNASLYPVHGLPAAGTAESPQDTSWIHNIGPLLNTAMEKVNQLRPTEIQTQVGIRFKATYDALEKLRDDMNVVPGQKELVWVTYGIPSSIRFVGQNWVDCTPLLRQLATRYSATSIAIYTVDPGVNIGRGILNRDALQSLTGNTGGRSFTGSDLRATVARAVADARNNYSIQYNPPLKNWGGKYHKVRLSCDRKDVHILTEEGYFAPGQKEK